MWKLIVLFATFLSIAGVPGAGALWGDWGRPSCAHLEKRRGKKINEEEEDCCPCDEVKGNCCVGRGHGNPKFVKKFGEECLNYYWKKHYVELIGVGPEPAENPKCTKYAEYKKFSR